MGLWDVRRLKFHFRNIYQTYLTWFQYLLSASPQNKTPRNSCSDYRRLKNQFRFGSLSL